MDKKIGIIIVNFNGCEDTRECLTSLQWLEKPHTIYLVDNGSKDHSLEILPPLFPHVVFIDGQKNNGFAGGNNLGIDKALKEGCTHLFLLNNDTTAPVNFLPHFFTMEQEHPNAGIFGPTIFRYDTKKTIDHLGGLWNATIAEFESLERGKTKEDLFAPRQVDYVCGCAMLIKKEVFDRVGFFDERFFLLWEEADFCKRAMKKGYEIWTVPKAHIFHKISASFEGKDHSHYFWWRNRLLYLHKHPQGSKIRQLVRREIYKEFRHALFKGLTFYLAHFFTSNEKNMKRWHKWQRLKAGCLGIFDYFIGRFGPPFSFRKKKKPFFSK
jgi:GT2 family glycosyltransferase